MVREEDALLGYALASYSCYLKTEQQMTTGFKSQLDRLDALNLWSKDERLRLAAFCKLERKWQQTVAAPTIANVRSGDLLSAR